MAQSSVGFQSQVNTVPAPGVEGDFSSLNPAYLFPAGPGGLVAGASLLVGGPATTGVLVGRFAWPESNFLDPDNAPTVVNNYGSGPPMGIIGRRQRGLITTFLAEASLMIPSGLPLAVITAADLWIVNRGTTQALIGQKAYAAFLDGSASFAATGSPTTGASGATSTIAPGTFSVTGSITGNILTVTLVSSGVVYPGSTISGNGSAGKVTAQLSGAIGGIGTYALSVGEQTVASGTITGTYGLFTAGVTTGGTFAANDVLTGTGVTAGTVITATNAMGYTALTGLGATGTYVVDPTQTANSTTISVAAINAESRFYAQSSGAVGELVKVSALPGLVGA